MNSCIPYYSKLEGKELIIKLAQQILDSDDDSISDDYKKIHQYAIDNELHDPIMDLILNNGSEIRNMFNNTYHTDWIIIGQYNWDLGCKLTTRFKKTIFSSYNDFCEHIEFIKQHSFVNLSITPEILPCFKYPIHTEAELIDCLRNGFVDNDGVHYGIDDYKYRTKIENILEFMKSFFEKIPNGVVVLGHYYHDVDCGDYNECDFINTDCDDL